MIKKYLISIFLLFCLIYLISINAFADSTGIRTLYSIDRTFQVVEHGKVTVDRAYEVIDEYIEAQKGLEGEAGYVISKSMFGFSIDDNTFIEIYIDDENTYRMKFEYPLSSSSVYQKEIEVPNKNELRKIVEKFFNQKANDFKNYFDNL